MRNIRTFLELIRLPGMFTAQADIAAGFLIAGAGPGMAGHFLALVVSSSCLFSAGMALNDYFDADIDSKERPDRPIPSGRISRPTAFVAGLILMGTGIVFAAAAGWRSFFISVLLAAAIFLYDGVLKPYDIAGPLGMAFCRYLNLLMGLSILPFDGWIYIPLMTGVYIFGVTTLSRVEAVGGKAVSQILVSSVCVALVPLIGFFLYLSGILTHIRGPILAMVFAMAATLKISGLLDRHEPGDFQDCIRFLLLSIILLETIICTGFVPVAYACLILVLYFPAFYSVRLFRVT